MKVFKKIILVNLIIMLAVAVFPYSYSHAGTDSTRSVGASGTKPLTPGAILDDFRYGASINIWGATTGTFSSSTTVPPPANAICTSSFAADMSGGAGHSLKLDYNVTATDSYAGYFSQMGGGSLTSPTAFTAISFYVKGAVGGEFFKIQLKNNSTASYWDAGNATHYFRNTALIYITDYLDGGVTTAWQKVTIPFHNFANLDGWSAMKEFDIVFENAQCVLNGSPTQGTIYIDNINFETSAIAAVRIDHFGDKLGTCALGGNMGTSSSGGTITYSFSNATNEYSPYPYGMKLTYNVSAGGSWAANWILFGGGNTDNTVEHPEKGGWIAVPHDFTNYTYLQFRLKARSDAENPKIMKVEVANGANTAYGRIISITSGWQVYRLNLSLATDLYPLPDKSSIKKLTFTFEQSQISGEGGIATGTVLIDSVEFVQ